jgi:hypothetical protein
MMSKSITESDAFYDLPLSAQALYLHLCQNADDDGFIGKPKTVQRMAKCRDKDMKILADKKFVIMFDSGVVCIKHWKIHNYIPANRHKDTNYKEELATLHLDENNAYTTHSVTTLHTDCIQIADKPNTQVRLGKGRLGKDSLGEVRIGQDSVVQVSVEDMTTGAEISDLWHQTVKDLAKRKLNEYEKTIKE